MKEFLDELDTMRDASQARVRVLEGKHRRRAFWVIAMWTIFLVLVFAALSTCQHPAYAAEIEHAHPLTLAQSDVDDGSQPHHPPEHEDIHDKFYKDWLRLDAGDSCCSKSDCFPTIMIERPDGSWWALQQWAMKILDARERNGESPRVPAFEGNQNMWQVIPPHLLEHNARRTDIPGIRYPRSERPSPDGRSHACISNGNPLCAVVGGGI